MHLQFDIKDHSEWTKTIIFIKNAQFISACAEVRILVDYISRDYNNTKSLIILQVTMRNHIQKDNATRIIIQSTETYQLKSPNLC